MMQAAGPPRQAGELHGDLCAGPASRRWAAAAPTRAEEGEHTAHAPMPMTARPAPGLSGLRLACVICEGNAQSITTDRLQGHGITPPQTDECRKRCAKHTGVRPAGGEQAPAGPISNPRRLPFVRSFGALSGAPPSPGWTSVTAMTVLAMPASSAVAFLHVCARRRRGRAGGPCMHDRRTLRASPSPHGSVDGCCSAGPLPRPRPLPPGAHSACLFPLASFRRPAELRVETGPLPCRTAACITRSVGGPRPLSCPFRVLPSGRIGRRGTMPAPPLRPRPLRAAEPTKPSYFRSTRVPRC